MSHSVRSSNSNNNNGNEYCISSYSLSLSYSLDFIRNGVFERPLVALLPLMNARLHSCTSRKFFKCVCLCLLVLLLLLKCKLLLLLQDVLTHLMTTRMDDREDLLLHYTYKRTLFTLFSP